MDTFNKKLFSSIIGAYVLVIIATVTLLTYMKGDTQHDYPRIIERNDNVIVEDTVRWHFPDSVTTVKPETYIIWYDGDSVEVEHDIVVNKPDGLKIR